MTTTERSPAEERLLDAALAQLLGGVRAPAVPQPPRTSWLAAAGMLLGVLVAAGVLWLAPREQAPLQEPAPLPPPVRAEGRTQVEALPADATNLSCWLLEPSEFELLRRFRSVRRLSTVALSLRAGPVRLGTKHAAWATAATDALAPLAELQALETLRLPRELHLLPEHLLPLQRCANLRELELVGEHVRFTAAMVDALRRLPNLRTLRLDLVALDGAAMQRLAALGLEELEVSRCPGFDAAAFGHLCGMPSLRRLSFRDLGRRDFAAKDAADMFWRPTPADLQRLTDLPRLQRLDFQGCRIDGEDLQALPLRLEELRLWGHDIGAEGFQVLRRFGALRRLELGTRGYDPRLFSEEPLATRTAATEAVAEALGSLRLESLHFTGVVTEPLLRQLATQPDLAELRLADSNLPDLSALAKAPALRLLQVYENRVPPKLTLDDLRPLAGCRALRRLDLGSGYPFSPAEAAAALGGKVEVTIAKP